MNSIATSALKNLSFDEASRSIATNAENAVRMTNAKENFANTATSARGKKRTHGIVFKNNHRNNKGRYVHYYRSPEFADLEYNNYKQNPLTREWNRVKLARFSNTSRKPLFDRAVADKNAPAMSRLLNERYVLTPEVAADAIRAVACRPHGLEAVQRILTATKGLNNDELVARMYRSIFQCSKSRAQDLILLFMKFDIVPNCDDYGDYYNDKHIVLVDVIDWGLDNGLDVALLKKLIMKSIRVIPGNETTPHKAASSLIARIFVRQLKRHPTGHMPPRLKQLFACLGGGMHATLIVALFAVSPRPARIIRWLVEDAGYRVTVNDVISALHFRHMQVAVYMASKRTWSDAEKDTLTKFLDDRQINTTNNGSSKLPRARESFKKNVRAPAFSRILREVVGLPAPAPPTRGRGTRQYVYSSLVNGNVMLYGPQTSFPPQHVRVHNPQHGNSNVTTPGVRLLQIPKSRLPPERIASQANLNAWERRHGIIRGTIPRRTNRWGFTEPIDWSNVNTRSIVPPPRNVRNRDNSQYVKANKAARTIQAAYKKLKNKKKK